MSVGGNDARPLVAPPREWLPVPLALSLGGVLALGLFLSLNAHRLASRNGRAERQEAPMPAPPALAIPPAAPAPMPATSTAPAPLPGHRNVPRTGFPPAYLPAGAAAPISAEPPHSGGGAALVVDLTTGPGAAINPATPPVADPADEAARATLIRNRTAVMPQGTVIAAVLETPLNSDRPGLARALVSHDARSFDGSRVLIPRGSRLIGEFKADPTPGLRRILVNWTRLIRPDGVAMRIASPGTDALGGAGVEGTVNSHFGERFASAVLQSALTIGVNVASALPVSGGSTVYLGLPGQAQQLGQQLVPNTNRPPTVRVREGAEIAVLLARDLDFGGTPPVR